MKTYLQKHFLSLIIVVLLVVILLQRCGGGVKPEVPNSGTKRDTSVLIINHIYKDTTRSKPVFIKGERDTILESSVQYLPSEDYNELYYQFNSLKESLLSKNIYKDSLKIDSLGYIKVVDTIQRNQIIGRSYITDLKIPEKTITIVNTVFPKPKRQLYIGGGVESDNTAVIRQINAGLMYKNKQDQLYGLYGGLNTSGGWSVGIQSYWKIKLKK